MRDSISREETEEMRGVIQSDPGTGRSGRMMCKDRRATF